MVLLPLMVVLGIVHFHEEIFRVYHVEARDSMLLLCLDLQLLDLLMVLLLSNLILCEKTRQRKEVDLISESDKITSAVVGIFSSLFLIETSA